MCERVTRRKREKSKSFLLLPLVPSFAETAFLSIPPTLPTTNDLIPPKGSVACEGRSLAQGLKQRRYELTMETFAVGYNDHGYDDHGYNELTRRSNQLFFSD